MHPTARIYWRFSVIDKVGNFGIFVLLKFENKLDLVISKFYFIAEHHDKYKLLFPFIQLE